MPEVLEKMVKNVSKKLYDVIEIHDLKDMLNQTKNKYGDKPAYQIKKKDGSYQVLSHREVRDMVDDLGTALLQMGLKNKRIAVIGENRYEWEIAYLAIACGTGIVVPLDKALPEQELESLIQRSEVEAIFYSEKYEAMLEKIQQKSTNHLQYLISMDLDQKQDNRYAQKELIQMGKQRKETGDRSFVDAKIDPEKMSMMLFTSGTTSKSKVVALSHKNICSNLMAIGSILNIQSDDVLLSILPIHHVFECTVGFLFSLYKGAKTVFCDGLIHIVDNLKEYQVSVMACVPGIYEAIYTMMEKQWRKQGKWEMIQEKEKQLKNASLEERRKAFPEAQAMLGGHIKLLICGAAALNPAVEEKYRLLGFNLVQGYGLTETSPVVAVGTEAEYKLGTIGKAIPGVEVKLANQQPDGMGELLVKGPNVALGYYQDERSTKASFVDGWFHTGDLATIDEEGYITICGRKKSVIVLKNGKNIFPEEMENLVNKITGVKESFVFGKQQSQDKNDIKIHVEVVFDKELVKQAYQAENKEAIYQAIFHQIKKINNTLPPYKAIRGMVLSEEPLIKTTTNKIKRQANLDAINQFTDRLFR